MTAVVPHTRQFVSILRHEIHFNNNVVDISNKILEFCKDLKRFTGRKTIYIKKYNIFEALSLTPNV